MTEKKSEMREKLAYIISRIFDPSITFLIFLIVLFLKTGLTPQQFKIVLPGLLIIDLLIPMTIYFLSLGKHWISDWEISKREERVNLYFIFCLFLFAGNLVIYLFGNQLLFRLHLIFTLSFLAGTLVTLFWKISMHLLIDTTIISLLDILFGGLWYFYLLLPLIAWSRFVRHKHTPAQLFGGFLLAILVVFLGVNLVHL